MTRVLDAPVGAIGGEDLLGAGLCGSAASDTVGDLESGCAGFLFDAFAFDQEYLTHMGEIHLLVQSAAAPDAARFDAPMLSGADLGEIGIAAIAKQQCDVALQRRLVAFDAEEVVRLAFDQVRGELALGVQGIGGDVAPGHIDCLQQWDRHADLVGALLRLAARYG